MPNVDSATQAQVLQSLLDAYLATDKAYLAANAAKPDAPELGAMMDARNHALLSYLTANKESLVNNSGFTQKLKQDLDAATKEINNKLTTLKDVSQWLTLATNLANLAGSLASAFA